jgi:large conductance mechanosensitive channel
MVNNIDITEMSTNLTKKSLVGEFKEFALKGSVLDLAVGIVIGSAFGAIVNSFVNDLIMPFVGFLTAGKDFSKMQVQLGEATIMYGNFIQTLVNFFVIAFAIFIMVKFINVLRRPKNEDPEPVPEVSPETEILSEIRDILKDK